MLIRVTNVHIIIYDMVVYYQNMLNDKSLMPELPTETRNKGSHWTVGNSKVFNAEWSGVSARYAGESIAVKAHFQALG